MANDNTQKTQTVFVNFKNGLKHPKLSWVIMMLNKYGIAHNLVQTVQGRMLQVEQGTLELAAGIICQELASFEATTVNNEEAGSMKIVITIDDLPDDHAFFEAQIEGQTIKMPRLYVTDPLPVDEDDDGTTEVADAVATLKAGAPDPDEDDDDDENDWDFDDDDLDDDDEDEDEDDDPDEDDDDDVIDVEHKVIEPEPETPAIVVVKKKKKEKREAVDPDFETATKADGDLSAPVDGTEFLQADEVLQFEAVPFAEVKKPIVMYDIDSSTVSAMGAKVLTTDPLIVTLYVRFKSGGTVYRYNPVATADWNTLLNLAIRRHNGIQEASVGSFFHHAIKVKGEEGLIKCQRLTDDPKNPWVIVLPKSERTKAIKTRGK